MVCCRNFQLPSLSELFGWGTKSRPMEFQSPVGEGLLAFYYPGYNTPADEVCQAWSVTRSCCFTSPKVNLIPIQSRLNCLVGFGFGAFRIDVLYRSGEQIPQAAFLGNFYARPLEIRHAAKPEMVSFENAEVLRARQRARLRRAGRVVNDCENPATCHSNCFENGAACVPELCTVFLERTLPLKSLESFVHCSSRNTWCLEFS